MRQFLTSIKEALEVRVNQRGNALDASPTFRDLVNAKVISMDGGIVVGGQSYTVDELLGIVNSVVPDWVTSDTAPPAPTGLVVTPNASTVTLTWTTSLFDQHGYTEVWAASSNNISFAELIGSSTGNSYVDALASIGIQRYYWIRDVARNGLTGPFNDVNGDGVLDGPDAPVTSSAFDGPDVVLSWPTPVSNLTIQYYEVQHYIGSAWTALAFSGSNTLRLRAEWAGARQFRVRSIDVRENASVWANITVTVVVPGVPTSTTSTFSGANSVIKWLEPATGSVPVVSYRVYDTTQTAPNLLTDSSSTAYTRAVAWLSKSFIVAAVDTAGNEGAPVTITSTVAVPTVSGNAPVVSGQQFKLEWVGSQGSIPIAGYEVRYGASFAAGTPVAELRGNTVTVLGAWLGERQFWVRATDVAGNVSVDASISAVITAAVAPVMTVEVVDNNVLLRWTSTPGTLPTERFTLRKGSTFAGATVIGNKDGGFTTVFETVAGTYTYWLAAVDSAGNVGAPASVTTTVQQPPDFVLGVSFTSAFAGTKSNCVIEGVNLVVPINPTETQATHFTSRGWGTPDAQVAAGYPIFIQPGTTTGYYEEDFDCGTTLAAMQIKVNYLLTTVAGTVNMAIAITTALDSGFTSGVSSFTSAPAFATNFRYVRVRITATATDDKGIAIISGLLVALDAKLKSFSGTVSAASGDSGGTTVYMTSDRTAGGTKVFVDVDAINLTALSTVARVVIYDFVDAANPLSFKVLVYDNAGTRQSCTVSYTVRGY